MRRLHLSQDSSRTQLAEEGNARLNRWQFLLRGLPRRQAAVARLLPGLLILSTCQLVGEFVVRTLHAPIPGPVLGMVLLFICLQIARPHSSSSVDTVSNGLMRHMQLVFVPAGVGVIQYLSVIGTEAVPLAVGLLASWFAALTVTAATASALLALNRRRVT